MTTWYLGKIQYAKQLENGKIKVVTEAHLVDAVSFSDAEARLYRCLGETIKEFNILTIGKTNYGDIFNYEDCEIWYKCKVSYMNVDEDSGKERRISTVMLVSATDPKLAYERIQESLKSWIVPYEITDVNLTTLMEVFPYFPNEDEPPRKLQKVLPIDEKELLDEAVEVVEETEIEETPETTSQPEETTKAETGEAAEKTDQEEITTGTPVA